MTNAALPLGADRHADDFFRRSEDGFADLLDLDARGRPARSASAMNSGLIANMAPGSRQAAAQRALASAAAC
jgi:hypothetical protein